MKSTMETQWKCHPKAEHALVELLEGCSRLNPAIARLQEQLLQDTSTRLFDWLDHLIIGSQQSQEEKWEELGFVSETVAASYRVLHHPGAQFPRLVVMDEGPPLQGVAVSVESIADFLMVRGMSSPIEGSPLSPYRRCCVADEQEVSLWVVERRSTTSMEPTFRTEKELSNYFKAVEVWQSRSRNMEDEDEAMGHAITVAQQMIALVGEDLAAWIILDVERRYWQSKNHAAQVQKNRQDHLGMGWANHDHHTFRSSRHLFPRLVRFFEMVGFYCRERFYAGQEAGWGAQVMEHPRCRLVLFLDVDLQPHELALDFRHSLLEPLPRHRTVGMWCALHGDSILKGGMHHLEGQFLFDTLIQDLGQAGITTMDPFSHFPYLKQAFTKGEMWPVDERRLENLLKAGEITEEQSKKFRTQGAIGSHLENLQRREGYKGFNQHNVSDIIQRTDPRNINF